MKFLKQLSVFSLAIALFTTSSCKRDVDTYVPDNNNVGLILNPSPVQASVNGKVVDENEQVVVGATVVSGNNTTTTDNRGLFRFDHIQMDKYASVVTVTNNGYFKGVRTFSATEGSSNFVRIKLIPKTLIGTVDASTGGAVSLSNNSIVTLQANSVVVKSTGLAYTGTINLYAANIDPTLSDIPQTIPGSFQAIDKDNYRVILKSYGMLAVQLEGQSGELLQIATDKTARLRFIIPASLASDAPSSIPLWSLNETDGLWKQEGTATKTAGYYEGDVSHFSFWNCDAPANTIYFEATVTTADGPLPNAYVKITRNNGWTSGGYTDSSGHVGGLVFSNEPMLFEIYSNCLNAIYSQNIGPYTQNTNLGTINVSIPSLVSLSISGHAIDCNLLPVTNGDAKIYWEGQVVNIPIVNGDFATTITRCSGSSDPVEIIVIDHTTQQQSTTWSGSAATGIVDAGTLSACGISNIEYIDYSVNGQNYSISSSAPYYINQSSMQGYFSGINPSDSVGFGIDYTNIMVGGSQQLLSFTSNHIASATNYSFNPLVFVTITEFGSVGQFIAGNFSGTMLTNGPNNTYNISCSFRIRRTF